MQDYTFTGAGLGTFPMVYSTYVLLINVPYLPHAQNLFLQIWFEQGLLGMAALAWLLVTFYGWVWRRRSELNWLTMGGVAATTVMLLHGLTDAPFWYSKWSLLLLFMPMALAVAGQSVSGSRKGAERWQVSPSAPFPSGKASPIIHFPLPAIAVSAVLIAALGLMLAIGWKQVAARWYANLGSVAETGVELGSYSFPDHLVEYTRRLCGSDPPATSPSAGKGIADCASGSAGRDGMDEAEGYFRQALAVEMGM